MTNMTNIDLNLNIDWDRSLFIDTTIDDDLVRRLTPTILSLRQKSTEPITVAIDSPGGSLSALDVLLGLLTGPTQCGATGRIVTVNTNHAFSAAANLLAFGNYAVALKHSDILFHDVRWNGMRDVTPTKARNAAKSLQEANDNFAQKLADRIVHRLIWNFIDQRSEFDKYGASFPQILTRYQSALGDYGRPIPGKKHIDIAGFATCLYARLSVQNDELIDNVMERLSKWVLLRGLAESIPTYRPKGSRKAGLLDGAKYLHKVLGGQSTNFDKSTGDIKLLLTLLIAEMSYSDGNTSLFPGNLDEATRNFMLIKSMNDSRHRRSATELMLRNKFVFFDENLEEVDEERKKALISEMMPFAQLFWLFCVSLSRELFEGEHVLSPADAQLLGLIDEVAGGGPIESKREFQEKTDRESAEAKEEDTLFGSCGTVWTTALGYGNKGTAISQCHEASSRARRRSLEPGVRSASHSRPCRCNKTNDALGRNATTIRCQQ